MNITEVITSPSSPWQNPFPGKIRNRLAKHAFNLIMLVPGHPQAGLFQPELPGPRQALRCANRAAR